MTQIDVPEILVFVRHPEGKHNTNHQKFVSGDIPNHLAELTERGEEQAAITGEFVRSRFGEFDTRFTSTYFRTKRLMEVMSPSREYIEDARLDERRMGAWHQYPRAKVITRYPDAEKLSKRDGYYHHVAAEGGESCSDVEVRAHSFYTDIRLFHGGEKVLVAAHGMWLMCMWRILSKSTVQEWYSRYESRNTFKNASVLAFQCCSEGTLECKLDNYVPWDGKL
ncbi:MAG: phosphoglycerate mutase family protein [Candidatus Pacebacteria bacterium]|nr:phosphoglycerate mutase family protein [Candidatus Paceibacterota bacterium]